MKCSSFLLIRLFPGGSVGKEIRLQCFRHRRRMFDPWVWKIPWRRAWQPTLVFLPGESYGQRSLTGYSPWGHRESDTTEAAEHMRTVKSTWLSESSRGSSPFHSCPILWGFLGKTLIWTVFPFPKSYSWRTSSCMWDFCLHSVLGSDQI